MKEFKRGDYATLTQLGRTLTNECQDYEALYAKFGIVAGGDPKWNYKVVWCSSVQAIPEVVPSFDDMRLRLGYVARELELALGPALLEES